MGWDVKLNGVFRFEKEPRERLIEILTLVEDNSFFLPFFSFSIIELEEGILRNNLCNYFDVNLNIGEDICFSLQQIEQQKNYMFRGGFSAIERYFSETDAQSDKLMINKTGYRVSLSIPGEDKYGLPLSDRNSFSYFIGNSRLFSPSFNGEAVQLNLQAVAQEIIYLSSLGIETIQGMDVDGSQDPENHFLIYHRNISAFVEEIFGNINSGDLAYGVIESDIQFVADKTSEIEYHFFNGGALVFNQRGVEGHLRVFYHNLRKHIESMLQ
jgi:hypothetical protein